MAQRVIQELVDDLDGGQANETVRFALDGVSYEIDLSQDNADGLRTELERYVSAGRRTGGRRATVAARVGGAPARVDREQLRAIREWARTNGLEVSDRGRLPRSVVQKFEEHHATPPAEEPVARKPRGRAAAERKVTTAPTFSASQSTSRRRKSATA
ncbi:hypothetical protein JOD54_001082 [Actinokineospora baliensis]|uniref:histone-like nucleoid-structuring protein Lsr2 n=1 Tax=Actinokineospora baliensis TaxID=547056 RepID=UPI00195EF5EF|nr:Lsr2 family protein [Actinokineospora baliensis]MBM7770878.1 hypothetical protein [Actinokineospora baliensis]